MKLTGLTSRPEGAASPPKTIAQLEFAVKKKNFLATQLALEAAQQEAELAEEELRLAKEFPATAPAAQRPPLFQSGSLLASPPRFDPDGLLGKLATLKRESSAAPSVAGPSKVRKTKTPAAVVDISSGDDTTADIPAVLPEATVFSPPDLRRKGKGKAVGPAKEQVVLPAPPPRRSASAASTRTQTLEVALPSRKGAHRDFVPVDDSEVGEEHPAPSVAGDAGLSSSTVCEADFVAALGSGALM